MQWFPDHIVFTIMDGAQPIGTTANVIKTETYSSDATNIPQVAIPVGINFWCFKHTPAKDQSVIIRHFPVRAAVICTQAMGTSGCGHGLIQPTVVSCAPHLRQMLMSRFQYENGRPPQQPLCRAVRLCLEEASDFDLGKSPEEGSRTFWTARP